MTTKETRRQGQKLLKEVSAIRRSGTTQIAEALRLLTSDVALDPKTLPTRQQRRKAERDAAKRKRGAE